MSVQIQGESREVNYWISQMNFVGHVMKHEGRTLSQYIQLCSSFIRVFSLFDKTKTKAPEKEKGNIY